MNDTNTNKADDMNEDDVTLTGPEGENTASNQTRQPTPRPTRQPNPRMPPERAIRRRYRTACSSPSSSTTTVTTPTPS